MTPAVAAPDETLRGNAALVGAGFVLSFVLIGGGIDTVGVFINAIVQSTDWSRSSLSLGVAAGAVTGALSTPWVGAAVDRHGVRVPMAAGVALLAVGFAILLRMELPWHWLAANVFLGAGFAATALLPLTVAITVSVLDRPALALGLAGTGASAGALVLAPLLQSAVESFGWRQAYVLLAAGSVLTPLPILARVLPRGPLRRDAPASPVKPAPLAAALGRPAAVGLVALMVLHGLVAFAVSVHLVPLLAEAGHAGATAALALGATIGISAVGKIGGGGLADRIGSLAAMRVTLALAAASFALLAAAARPAALGGFVATYGLSLGTYVAVVPALAREILGRERFGSLFGLLQLGSLLAAAAGPVAAGLLYDATGGYGPAVAVWSLALLAAFGVSVAMRTSAGPPP